MKQHLGSSLDLLKRALKGMVPTRREKTIGEKEEAALRSVRVQEGYAKVLVSKVADLQKGFEETWSWQDEVCAALAAEVGAEDEPAWNTNTYTGDRTKSHHIHVNFKKLQRDLHSMEATQTLEVAWTSEGEEYQTSGHCAYEDQAGGLTNPQ